MSSLSGLLLSDKQTGEGLLSHHPPPLEKGIRSELLGAFLFQSVEGGAGSF